MGDLYVNVICRDIPFTMDSAIKVAEVAWINAYIYIYTLNSYQMVLVVLHTYIVPFSNGPQQWLFPCSIAHVHGLQKILGSILEGSLLCAHCATFWLEVQSCHLSLYYRSCKHIRKIIGNPHTGMDKGYAWDD